MTAPDSSELYQISVLLTRLTSLREDLQDAGGVISLGQVPIYDGGGVRLGYAMFDEGHYGFRTDNLPVDEDSSFS